MKKKNTLISLASTMALLCIGGGFALSANAEVSAEETKQQTMLGASILVANEQTGIDSNGIRFPVVVKDEVAEKITESKVYVLPKDHWTGVEKPTAEQVKANGTAFDTTEKWVNYYEQDKGYGDEYSEAVVYMYNIPTSKYATDFYVCSWMKLDDNTEELSDVIDRSMTYVAQKAVESGAYSTDDLGNYIQATYKVNKYLRTVYGSYELTGESTTVTGVAGEIPTVDGVDGYTINATLTAQANPELYDGATLNFYYENNDYTFSQQEIGKDGNGVHTNLTYEKRAMTNVSPENLRGNTYYYKKTVNDGATWSKFEYDNSSLGKYLMLNTYYLSTWSSEPGVCFVAWNSAGSTVTDKILVKSYSDEGKFIDGTLIDYATAGNWITIVLYMDPAVLGANSTEMRLSFTSWTKNELYIGEYTYLTKDQFETYYEQLYKPSTFTSGVNKYEGEGLVVEDNTVALKHLSSYAKGSYVAITATTNVASPVKMYKADGTSKQEAMSIYNADGVQVTTVEANKEYTYIFYMDSAITVGETAGKMFVDTASNYQVTYSAGYTISVSENKKELNTFRNLLFETTDGVSYYTPNALTRQKNKVAIKDVNTATNGVSKSIDGIPLVGETSYTTDGYLKWTPSDLNALVPEYDANGKGSTSDSKNYLYRCFTVDGVSEYKAGDYVVVKMKAEQALPYMAFWTRNSSGGGTDYWTARAAFAEDRSVIVNKLSATGAGTSITSDVALNDYIGKWVYMVFKVQHDTVVTKDCEHGNHKASATRGSFILARAGHTGDVYLGGVYVMNQTGFNTYFGL